MSYFAALVTVFEAEETRHKLAMPWYFTTAAREIAHKHHIDVAELCGTRKPAPVVIARQELMWTLRQRGLSFPRIGQMLGRDHTTVMHGVRKHEARLSERLESAA